MSTPSGAEGGPVETEVPANRFFELPEYDAAFREFVRTAMYGLAATKDPILDQMPRSQVHRVYRPRNSIGGGGTIETPMMPFRNTFGFNPQAVVECDIDDIISSIDALAEAYAAAIVPQIFGGISAVTSALGNTIDAGGEPFTWDMALDLMDRMAIAFDDNDEPVVPTLHIGPDRQLPEMTEAQQVRMGEILERKRVAYLAGRRHRKLPRNPLGG